jgi:hypothetical protein
MKPITIVSGFGRCGTSMVMQMLEAGGMPVTGEWPAFEVDEAMHPEALSMEWLQSMSGRAVKILDLQRGKLPAGLAYNIIWLDRDPEEQAKSQAKMLRTFMGIIISREARRNMQKSFGPDRIKAMKMINAAQPLALFELRFEEILANPQRFAESLAVLDERLDAEMMALAVVKRLPKCSEDMSLELMLIRQREEA